MASDINAVPSYNPADLETQSGTMNYILRCNSMNNSVCIPAIVEEYDRKKNVVTVKPAITITATTGETLERENITATVMSLCGGKFIVNFPLEKGDTGWLITADRDISLFVEQRKVINANTDRIHSIEDSFFIPDRVNDFKLESEDEKNFVIQNLDRNIRISLAEDKIKIFTAPKGGGKEGGETSGESSSNGASTNNDSTNAGTAQTADSQKQSDKTEISITSGEVELETTGKVTIKSKQDVTCTVSEGNIECKCKNLNATVEETATVKAQTINLEGNVNIKGNVNIEGNTDCSGTITGSAVKAGSIDLAGHVHGGVENGGSKTGGAE